MTGATADIGADVVFLFPDLAVLLGTDWITIFVSRLESQIGYKCRITEMRLRIAMTIQAPLHGQRLHLRDDIHFVDSAMARDAADTCGDMRAVIEINKIWKVVNALPLNRVTIGLTEIRRLQAGSNRIQQRAFTMHDAKRSAFLYTIATVTVSASRCWRYGSMARLLNRVVTVTTIQFELTRVEFVRKRHRLFWLVTDIHN